VFFVQRIFHPRRRQPACTPCIPRPIPPPPSFISADDVGFIDVNDPYSGTNESCGGYALFCKHAMPTCCWSTLEGRWQVKQVSGKVTNACMTYVASGCAHEDCTSRQCTMGDANLSSMFLV
jgi:hypothetical protein